MSFLSTRRLRARIEPHLHWKVPFEAGMYANSPRWSNKDLDPIPPERRTWGGVDYWAYWASDMVSTMPLSPGMRSPSPLVFCEISSAF